VFNLTDNNSVVNDNNLNDYLHFEAMVSPTGPKTIPSIHKTRPVTTIPTIFSTTVLPMNETTAINFISINFISKISPSYEDQCKLYGLRWLGNNTCYKELVSPDWFAGLDSYKLSYNKTTAIKMCKITNATLPYSE